MSAKTVSAKPVIARTACSTSSTDGIKLPKPDLKNITVLTRNLPNNPILPWNHYDSPRLQAETPDEAIEEAIEAIIDDPIDNATDDATDEEREENHLSEEGDRVS
jgi:hypothetical protein